MFLLTIVFSQGGIFYYFMSSAEFAEDQSFVYQIQGSSINWMMQQFMGIDKFAEGLEIYIKRFEGKNAVMTDLFDALGEV